MQTIIANDQLFALFANIFWIFEWKLQREIKPVLNLGLNFKKLFQISI